MVAVLSITVTADKVRNGDLIYVMGYLQDPDTPPYVAGGITINLHLNDDPTPVASTITANNGTYFFVFTVKVPTGTYTIRAVAPDVPVFGTVISDPVTITVGDVYIPYSTSYQEDPIELFDWIGPPSAVKLNADGTISMLPPYIYISWLVFAFGVTPDRGHSFMYYGGVHPAWNIAWTKLRVDDNVRWESWSTPTRFSQNYTLPNGYVLPSLYTDPVLPKRVIYSLNPATQQWFYQLTDVDFSFTIEAHTPRGPPIWIGRRHKMERPAGILSTTSMEAFGVVVAVCEATIILETAQGTLTFDGMVGLDHEVHSGIVTPEHMKIEHALQSYNGVFVWQKDMDIACWYAINPENGLLLSKEGRINFPQRGLSFQFNNFELISHPANSLFSESYELRGMFDGGTVNLHGDVIANDFKSSNDAKTQSFCNPFIHWTGTISGDGQTLPVDAYGWGEETKVTKVPPPIPFWKVGLVLGSIAGGGLAAYAVTRSQKSERR